MGLDGAEKYKVQVGLVPKGDSYDSPEINSWSGSLSAKTKRGWGLAKVLTIIGALGLFIFGMKTMSEGMQRAAGEGLKQMLGSITSNRFKGVATGFLSTGIVQSSSVTTVMTVSLVNAGLLTLRQSAGVMMGANIGTTITAWLVLLLGFKVSIASYALMLIAIGAPLLFLSFDRSKDVANAIIGFSILFIGLQFLKDSVPDLDKDSAIVRFFVDYKDIPVISNIMFVMLGALVTVIIQSSSAAMALTLTMVSKGIIPYEVACAMILGENIGTTITAELASTIGNVHAKRSARIHSLFNVIGVTWMLIAFPLFTKLVGYLIAGDAFDPMNVDHADSGIALFHTIFNGTNVLLLIWFVPQIVRFAERTVSSKGESDETFKLDYMDGAVVNAPSIALMEAKKEVARYGKITSRMNQFVRTLLNETDRKVKAPVFDQVGKYEQITDRIEVEVAQFLEKLSKNEVNEQQSGEIRALLSISNDLERIGDVYHQISRTLHQKDENRIYFVPQQRNDLNTMLNELDNAFRIMNRNLQGGYGELDLGESTEQEDTINELRDKFRKKYLKTMEKGDPNFKGSLIYNDMFSLCEKIGDHIVNVNEAVAGMV